MKISTLVNALTYYQTCENVSANEKKDAMQALIDATRLQDIGWLENQGDIEAEIISYDDFLSLANIALYDLIGEVMREDVRSIDDLWAYKAKIKDHVTFLTVPQLKNAVSFLQDLWLNNEEYGYNDELGHFKK